VAGDAPSDPAASPAGRPRRRRSPAGAGLAAAVGLLLALLAAEVVVRAAGVAPEISPVRRGRIQLSANPRLVFERLFGSFDAGLDPETRARRQDYRRSVLDLTTERSKSLMGTIGASDRRKVDEYFTSIREVERRIQMAEQDRTGLPEGLEKPTGIPVGYDEYATLMFELQRLAMQADLTRVISFMVGKEQSARPYPEIGVPDAHHPLSHHNQVPELIQRMSLINRYHAELAGRYLKRLAETPDVDGSLLDNLIVLYGSGISNSSGHSGRNLPLMVLGGGAGTLQGGKHLKYDGSPVHANLLVTLMDKMGVPMDKVGGSTGALAIDPALDTLPGF